MVGADESNICNGGFGIRCVYGFGLGHKQEKEGKSLSALLSIPYYFVLLNVASYKAFTAFVRGEKKVIWNPRKG